jgi:hypothetical protein
VANLLTDDARRRARLLAVWKRHLAAALGATAAPAGTVRGDDG